MRTVLSTNTDFAWERLAQADPYHAVLTTHADRAEFFRSGERHVADLLERIRGLVGPGFKPQRILDFGCGVGRTAIPFSRHADELIGVDVAPTMLAEAARNCAGLPGVRLVSSLAGVTGQFDLIHSYTVFQHIPVRRGMRLLPQLAGLLADDGVGALHFTYARRAPRYRQVVHRIRAAIPGVNALVNVMQRRPAGTPMMQMNHYDIAAVIDVLGGPATRAYETDHGGHLGVMLLVRRGVAP